MTTTDIESATAPTASEVVQAFPVSSQTTSSPANKKSIRLAKIETELATLQKKEVCTELQRIRINQLIAMKDLFTTTTTTRSVAVPAGNSTHHAPLQTLPQATTAMCLGIASLVVFGIILGPIAICIGISAKNTIKANPNKYMGEGQATTGIVCGSIAIFLWIIVIIIVATGAATTTTTYYDYNGYN